MRIAPVGRIRTTPPDAILFFAVFSVDETVLDATLDGLSAEFGTALVSSQRFQFDDTRYYEASMGERLFKQLVAVDRIIAQDELAAIKIRTNAIEAEVQSAHPAGLERVVNIDPGMLDDGKVMLASTKNNAHRIYVGQGIFVEPTVYLRGGKWEPWPWTYSDYRRPEVHAFFDDARVIYRGRRPGAAPVGHAPA